MNNGTAWTSMGRGANTGTANNGAFVEGTLISGPLAAFGEFALASTEPDVAINPLPVELTAFSARRQPAGVALNWRTASEKNSARFEVQRSLNGETFATVATVAAAGTSSQPLAYTALDRAAPQGLLYYRLRQVDTDGTASLSPVVTVAAGKGDVVLYPNPARETLNIIIIAEGATAYRVLTQLGQPVLTGTIEAGAPAVNVSKLAPGVYHFELQTSAGRVVRKFVKE
jgi:hypothetical protein